MRIHPINELPSTIILGRQTETGVNEVRLDCAEWLALWPELKISIHVTPPGGTSTYPAQTHMESDVLVWPVTDSDTAVAGSGTMEVLGVADGQRKLSAIATTRILATTTITQGEAPVALPRAICTAVPNMPHQQLVSDASGKAVWVDRLAYKYTDVAYLIKDVALVEAGEEGGVKIFANMTPFATDIVEGKTYNVVYNGAEYACPLVFSTEAEGMWFLGNVSMMGMEGGNADAPFMFGYTPFMTEEAGMYGACYALDGATSVTISISTAGEKIVKLPQEYYDQGDWSADPGNPGHILNRTHWEMAVSDNIIVFDPAKVDEYVKVTHPDSGLVFYKVSDVPINKDTMRGVFDKVVMGVYGETVDSGLLGNYQSAHFDDMFENDDVSYSYINDADEGIKLSVVGVRNPGNTDFIPVGFPEMGTYIASADTPLHYVKIVFTADAKVIQRIPQRFVDTDALKSAINTRLPATNPSTEPGYWRWNGSKWAFATIDQLKADLGLT